LSYLRPARLTTMPGFPNDALDPSWSHGDLLLQVCAQRPDGVRAVLRQLLHRTGALLQPRWSIDGFRPENQVTGQVATTRNLFGFREGVGNPDPSDQALMDKLVWVRPGSGEPAWTAGGSYQVVRLIRFATELWDAEPVEHQEDVFGRHKQTGAPLAGKREDQVPNFATDPDGRITPLDAHIRRANPRTPETEASRILRRSYSYRRGRDAAGQPDEGLIFVCFQQDVERGFATVQRRLRGEALERYVLPFGGGYFFVLPAAPPGGYLGQQLFDAAR
jgi:deferrochelatase/peroxidase EfeB